MMVPFLGLLLGDVNYVLQAGFMHWSPYLLVLSDLLFGLVGGYAAIMSSCFSYSVRSAAFEQRSERVAFLEGAIGLGATVGSFVSGSLRQATSYPVVFVVIALLHALALAYIAGLCPDVPLLDTHEEERGGPG